MPNPALIAAWQLRLRLTRLALKPQCIPKPLVFAGDHASTQLMHLMAQHGYRRVLLITDAPLLATGLLSPLSEALEAQGCQISVFDEVLPDPPTPIIESGIQRALADRCDAVLGAGGGSSLDVAKVVALAAANAGCSVQQLVGLNKARRGPLPLFAAPTTAGTGSEASLVSVISNPSSHEKQLIADPRLVPLAAALDPALTESLPPQITAATGMDALTHAVEAYIGRWGTPETDQYARTAVQLILRMLPRAYRDGGDREARLAMALAAHYAGLAFTRAMVGYVHAIAHQLGARYGIAHGLANAVALPHVLEVLLSSTADKLAELSYSSGCTTADKAPKQAAWAFIERVKTLNQELGIPAGFTAIQAEHLQTLSRAALREGANYPVPRYLNKTECRAILRAMMA